MRLIDAEQIIIELSMQIAHFEYKAKHTEIKKDARMFHNTACGLRKAKEIINDAPVLTNIDVIKEFPTIINAPRGHWKIVDDDDGLKLCECSICGRREEIINFKNYPFCHCGALMDHPGLRYEAEDKNDGGEK